MASDVESQVQAFFKEYVAAIADREPHRQAALFAYPFHAMIDSVAGGLPQVFETEAACLEVLGSIRETYDRIGMVAGRVRALGIVELSPRLARAAVDWEALDAAGGVLYTFPAVYTLACFDGSWKITTVALDEPRHWRALAGQPLTGEVSGGETVRDFFKRYCQCVAARQPEAVAAFYAYPSHLASDAEPVQTAVLTDPAGFKETLEPILRLYDEAGVVSGRVAALSTLDLSPQMTQALVHWEVCDAQGLVIHDFDADYTLVRQGDGWRAVSVALNEMPPLMASVARRQAALAATAAESRILA